MTEQHTITPPSELVHQWHKESCRDPLEGRTFFESKTLKHIATRAAQWGADQELEACCDWMDRNEWSRDDIDELHSARRPKPLSLKQRALDLLEKAEDPSWDINDFSVVRLALEALPD